MLEIFDTNVTIMVKDINKSITFYEAIGFKIKERWDDHFAMLTVKDLTIGLHPSTLTESGSATVSIGLMIKDIEAAKTLLNQNKIKYSIEDGKSGTFLNFNDIDGTIIYFMLPKWK